jgi:hypothetical protein
MICAASFCLRDSRKCRTQTAPLRPCLGEGLVRPAGDCRGRHDLPPVVHSSPLSLSAGPALLRVTAYVRPATPESPTTDRRDCFVKTFVLFALLSFALTPSAFASSAQIPPRALVLSAIQHSGNWDYTFDSGTGGSASGQTSLVQFPSLTGSAREFVTTFTNYGGERYWLTVGQDTASSNFVYDAWLYIARPSSNIANIELDLNQVMSNGQTVIYGFQCDGYSGTWDFTENAGTPQNYLDEWVHSAARCNPRQWATNAWHHIQIEDARDNSGNVTYKAVWFDGVMQPINATVPSSFALGWGSVLLTNFQVDGLGSGGTATVLLDRVTIYRW